MAAEKISFQAGDVVELLAGFYAREDGTYINRGQQFEITEEEAARSDAHIVFGPADPITDNEDDDEGPIEFDGDESYEALKERLEQLNVKKAKQLLSSDQWTAEGMEMARQAEEDGQNRKGVLDFIEGRLADLEEEDEDDEGDDDE